MGQFFKDMGTVLFAVLIVGGLWGFGVCGLGLTALFSRAESTIGMKVFIVVSQCTLAGILPWTLMGGAYETMPGEEVWPRRLAGWSSAMLYLAGMITAGALGFGYW